MTRAGTRRLLLGLALLDLAVFGAWIGREEIARRMGTEVRLPVVGYDPRDLLSGHYIRFQLVAVREAEALDASAAATDDDRPHVGRRAYCLEVRAGGLAHVARRREPSDDCPLYVSGGRDKYASFDLGVDRFYVDERRRAEVAGIPASDDTYLLARVFDEGRVHPVDLVVRGKSLAGR